MVARLSLSVTRLARLLRQQEAQGVSPAASAALATIVLRGPITLGELAVAEQVSPSTITRVVNGLERRGLVERIIDPTDRRVHRVRMTRRARKAIEVYRSKRNEWLTNQLGLDEGTSREQLALVVKVLESLTAIAGPDPVAADNNNNNEVPTPEA